MNDSDSKKILEDVANGSTTSKQAAKKLGVTISEIWALIDSKNIGRRELNKDELEYLSQIRQRSQKIIELFILQNMKLEELSIEMNAKNMENYQRGEYRSRPLSDPERKNGKIIISNQHEINAA